MSFAAVFLNKSPAKYVVSLVCRVNLFLITFPDNTLFRLLSIKHSKSLKFNHSTMKYINSMEDSCIKKKIKGLKYLDSKETFLPLKIRINWLQLSWNSFELCRMKSQGITLWLQFYHSSLTIVSFCMETNVFSCFSETRLKIYSPAFIAKIHSDFFFYNFFILSWEYTVCDYEKYGKNGQK